MLELAEEVEAGADVEISVAEAPGCSEAVPARVRVEDINFGGISLIEPLIRGHIYFHDDRSTKIRLHEEQIIGRVQGRYSV